MAIIKRLNTHPDEPVRAAVRSRIAEGNPPETVTDDLNEPPPISGENQTMVDVADAGSSKQEGSKATPSSKLSDTSQTHLDEEALQAEEEERRLEEEYHQRMSAIRKRKEEVEQRRKEEAERLRKEEEERKQREEAERLRKEEEERVRAEKERQFEEERKRAEAEIFNEEEELRRKEEEEYQHQYQQLDNTVNMKELLQVAHSGENPIKRALRQKGMVTRSGVTISQKTPTKTPRRQSSGKGKGLEPSLSV